MITFNDVVKRALEDRESMQGRNSKRYSFEADGRYNFCCLYIHPFNGVYAEKSTAYYLYTLDDGKMFRTLISNKI